MALGLGAESRTAVPANVIEGVDLHVEVAGNDDAFITDGAHHVVAGLREIAGVGNKEPGPVEDALLLQFIDVGIVVVVAGKGFANLGRFSDDLIYHNASSS